MCAQKYVIKRISPPEFINKVQPDYYEVTVRLNQAPENDWIKLFREPSSYKVNEVYPKHLDINGDRITWRTIEMKVKSNVEELDNYIEQANEKYNRLLLDRENKQKKEEERQTKEKEELGKLSEKFKDL